VAAGSKNWTAAGDKCLSGYEKDVRIEL